MNTAGQTHRSFPSSSPPQSSNPYSPHHFPSLLYQPIQRRSQEVSPRDCHDQKLGLRPSRKGEGRGQCLLLKHVIESLKSALHIHERHRGGEQRGIEFDSEGAEQPPENVCSVPRGTANKRMKRIQKRSLKQVQLQHKWGHCQGIPTLFVRNGHIWKRRSVETEYFCTLPLKKCGPRDSERIRDPRSPASRRSLVPPLAVCTPPQSRMITMSM